MKDEKKIKKQLIDELIELRKKVAELVKHDSIESLQGIDERNQTKRLLRESEESFRALTENSQDVIMRFDFECRHLYVNLAVERTTGITAREFIGKTHNELGFPEYLCDLWESAIQKVFATGELNRIEFELPNKTWIDWLLMPELDQDGSVNYVITAARDITERKHMEQELKNYQKHLEELVNERTIDLQQEISIRKKTEESLKESEQKLRNIIEHSNELHYVHDINHILSYVSPQSFQILGYTAVEMMLEWTKLATDNPINEKGIEITERAIKTGVKQETYLLELRKKDSSKVLLEIDESPLKDKQGNVVGIVGAARNVTERKEAEEALRASEAELHNHYFSQAAINMILSESLENIPLEKFLQKALNMILSVPWIAFEAIGSISLVEDEADVLMMKAQSNLPEPLKELCVRVPFGKCLCGKAAQAQQIHFADHIEERHETCYERMVPHGHYSVPILSGGRTLGVLNIYLKEGHIRNQKEEEFLNTVANTMAGIIMRKHGEAESERLHAQLLQAQKMEAVGQLSGGIAHDFNNILTAILGFGNLLKMEVEKDSRLSTYMKHILDSAERAANLTQDLLAFSRKQMIIPKPINVNEVIKAVEKILLRLIGADIELSTHLSDKDLIVMADSTQMEHVLMNLATNARDAMPEGGNLLISSDSSEIDERFINMYGYGEKGRYAVMTVSDTGAGIDEQTKEKIFEPFFTTKEVGKGTGLGLAMVYGIVKQHDGFINVYSEQGKGTTFKIYLPLINAEITDTKEIESAISKGGTETILVAEDDAMVRKFMREVLEDAGYNVIEAKDGEDAIKVFIENKDRIQLLILDVIMPKKNGKEAYETIKKSSPLIKAIFTSGYSADILYKKGIISEGPEVILKPISSDNLLRKIRTLLD